MGVKAGLDAKVLIDIINASSGRNSATQDKFPRAVLPRTFDFGVTQVVDGNWGVHAIIKKSLFAGAEA